MPVSQGTSTLISQVYADLERFSLGIVLDKDTPRRQLIESWVRFSGRLKKGLCDCRKRVIWSFLDDSVDYSVDSLVDLY